MKVLIVGGGVAGLGLAGFLKDHAEITIVEKASHWGDVGFAITLWSNGQQLLRELGADHDVAQEGYQAPWGAIFDKRGDLLNAFSMELISKYSKPLIVTRTTLHTALTKVISPDTRVFFKTTVVSLTQENHGVTAVLSNGVTEFFDLVVGADGVRSSVREQVFGTGFIKPFGWNIWSFWTPRNQDTPIGAYDFLSGGRMFVIYPMEDRAVVLLSVASKTPLDIPAAERKTKLKEIYADFKGSVQFMLDSVSDDTMIFQDHLVHVEMSQWYSGRVALIGDAQHASSPLLGMGASLALEDAYVLAQELKRVGSNREVSTALANFAKRRGRRVSEYRFLSHLLEHVLMVRSPLISWIRSLVFRLLPARFFTLPIERILEYKL